MFAWLCLTAPVVAQPSGMLGSPQWFFTSVPATPPSDFNTPAGSFYVQSLHAVGRNDLHAALPNRAQQPSECVRWPATADGQPIAARLAELARDTTVVIINEAHDESRHREVVRELAVELRKQGYEYYAAETFSEHADEHPDEPFARLDVGTYTLDPAFGQLLRTVKGLGYRLVAYEHETLSDDVPDRATGVIQREEGQANNLVERIFRAEPNAKVLIHVGYSHATEVALSNFGQSIEWMATRLKAKTGIDPLTIDQTRCASSSGALELAQISASLPAGAHDVAVAHPPTVFFRGRPQWRIDAGAVAVDLPETFVSDRGRTLIEARYANEPSESIPLDRLLLWPGERLPLLLPAGEIRIEQYFEDGSPPRTLIHNVR